MVEVLDAAVEFKGKYLHAGLEIEREVLFHVFKFGHAFCVDGAVVAGPEPLPVHADAYSKPILHKAVLPVDAALVVEFRRVDNLFFAAKHLPAFQVELPVPEPEPDFKEPVPGRSFVQVCPAEGFVHRFHAFAQHPALLYQVFGALVPETEPVENFSRIPANVQRLPVAPFEIELFVREGETPRFNELEFLYVGELVVVAEHRVEF